MYPAKLSVLSLAGALRAIKTIHTDVTLADTQIESAALLRLHHPPFEHHILHSPQLHDLELPGQGLQARQLRPQELMDRRFGGKMLSEYRRSSRLSSIPGRYSKQDFLGGSWRTSVVGWHYADFGCSFERRSDAVSWGFGGLLSLCWLQDHQNNSGQLHTDAETALAKD